MEKLDQLVQFKLMLPADLKDRIEAATKDTRRSLSREMVAALEEKFPAPSPPIEDFSRLYALMELVMSGETREQREALLRMANSHIGKSPLAGRLELGISDDPSNPDAQVIFMRSLAKS